MLLGELDRMQGLVDDLLLLARGDERAFARTSFSDRRRGPRRGGADPPGARRGRPSATTSTRSSATRTPCAGPSTTSWPTPPATPRRACCVAVEADDREVTVHVDDDGPGIPVDQRDDVVRRFVRLDEGRTRDGGGAGLGLAVTADVAAAHAGRLEIGDSPLGGARLSLVLARAAPTGAEGYGVARAGSA